MFLASGFDQDRVYELHGNSHTCTRYVWLLYILDYVFLGQCGAFQTEHDGQWEQLKEGTTTCPTGLAVWPYPWKQLKPLVDEKSREWRGVRVRTDEEAADAATDVEAPVPQLHYHRSDLFHPTTADDASAAGLPIAIREADNLPVCTACGALARPNVLMFCDAGWIPNSAMEVCGVLRGMHVRLLQRW